MSEHDRAGFEALDGLLGAERRVVEYLLFKLVSARLLLAAEERRFVGHAFREIEQVLEALREAEVRRVGVVGQIAQDLAIPADGLSLSELVAQAPPALRPVLREHHEAFHALAAEIEQTAAHNRELASTALGRVQLALGALTGPAVGATYTASGRHDPPLAGPVRLDEVL